jgi:peptidoglycan/xylan/chitin deacetylase (PgdA/CDA1 family)
MPWVAAGLALVAAVVLAVAALNGSSGASRGGRTQATTEQAAISATARLVAPARKPSSPGAAAKLRQRENRAIGAALGYTPFITRGIPRHRVIALTFDDGPSPYTIPIVRLLARMHVPATFFVVGQQLNVFPRGVPAELQQGSTVGDHTQNHAWLSRLNASGQSAQIKQAAAGVQRSGAPAPRLFRPPYGAYDRATISTIKKLRMLMVLWSIDPGDWKRPGARAIAGDVLANAQPGAIVIMHDGGGDRSQTLAALPAIIKGLRRRHFQLVTVPQLVMLDPPPRHQRLPHLSGV